MLNEICINECTKRTLNNHAYVNLRLLGFYELNLEILYVFFFFFFYSSLNRFFLSRFYNYIVAVLGVF